MNLSSIDIYQSAEKIVHQFLGVQPGENVLIVCDPGSEMGMATALAGLVQGLGAEYTIAIMPTRAAARSNDLGPLVEAALEAADCLIGLTRHSGAPTYARKVKERFQAGRLRSISMVMRGIENFTTGGALADYAALHAEGQQLAAVWDQARTIRVTSPGGTDLQARIGAAAAIVECGYATQPGQEAAFPDGEVSQGPDEDTAEGMVVVDGPIAHLGVPDRPVALRVAQGRVVEVIQGGKTARDLARILREITNADNIAEVGIGLNGSCLQNGDFEEEKKARGNVHIAVGDNIFYGGQTESAIHIDMVIYRPSVWLGDLQVVSEGEVMPFPDE